MTNIPSDYAAFFRDNGSFGAYGMGRLTRPLASCPPRERQIPGYHVLHTAPYLERHPRESFALSDFEALTAELSARLWRRSCGPISLVTDPEGAAYVKNTPLADAYDHILPILDCRNYGISPVKYWAAGKLQALMKLDAPCALIDMDFLLWRPPELDVLTAAHTEPLRREIYPPLSYFRTVPEYTSPPGWDPAALPLNTAFVYFGDGAFQKYYARQSIQFMCAERETPDNGTVCMVLAEQRILGMCAAEWRLRPHTLLEYDRLSEPQDLATHIWSAKQQLRALPALQEVYCSLCQDRLRDLS